MKRARTVVNTDALGSRLEEPIQTGRFKPIEVLSSGSTLLNLACTDTPYGTFIPGRYYLFVGDSSSGKTFATMTSFAEACIHPVFKKYRLIYDGPEFGANFDTPHLFGTQVADKVEEPSRKGPSFYLEDFYDNVNRALDVVETQHREFIYVLDSQDSLTTEQESEKSESDRAARTAGKVHTGIMTDGKAKINSSNMRSTVSRLGRSKSILIVINQTRANLGMGLAKGYSGGHSLKFYATLQMWSKRVGTLSKTVLGAPRQVGIQVEVAIKKNRLTGAEHDVSFPIYWNYGIDDVASCQEYLMAEKVWTKEKGAKTMVFPELFGKEEMTVDSFLSRVRSDPDLYMALRKLVAKRWWDIRNAITKNMEPKYV